MRNELAEALLRVEQLSAQESVLKATIRALETDLKTERCAHTGPVVFVDQVAYASVSLSKNIAIKHGNRESFSVRGTT